MCATKLQVKQLEAVTTVADPGLDTTVPTEKSVRTAIKNMKLDDFATPDANTDLNANTTNHGLLLQATAPGAELMNFVGLTNGETAYLNKPLFDTTNPANLGTVGPGTSLIAARRDHIHAAAPSVLGNGASQYQTIITGATPFTPVYSGFLLDGTTGGKTILSVTNTKTLTLTSTGDFNATFPATGTVAMLNQANSFTLINPLTTIAESWIGPSSTTGIYFKGGNVGIGTTNPAAKLSVNDGGLNVVNLQLVKTTGGNNNLTIGNTFAGGSTFAINAGITGVDNGGLEIRDVDAGAARMVIQKTTGNVGIGITVPLARLHVTGTADDEVLILQANATQTANVMEVKNSGGTVLNSIAPLGNQAITVISTAGGNLTGLSTIISPTDNSFGIIYGNQSIAIAKAIDANATVTTLHTIQASTGFYSATGKVLTTTNGTSTIEVGTPVFSGAGTYTLAHHSGVHIGNQASSNFVVSYGLLIEDQTGSSYPLSIITRAGNVVFNDNGSPNADFCWRTDAYNGLFGDASNDSIMLMSNAAGKVGFFGITAVVQQTELTDELTTVTCTAPGTPDYVIQDLVQNTGFGFVTADEGQSALKVIANLQTRVNELETKLVAYGLLVDAD